MEKYFNEKELSIIHNVWKSKGILYIDKYKGLFENRNLSAFNTLKEHANDYRTEEEFMKNVLESSKIVQYIQSPNM